MRLLRLAGMVTVFALIISILMFWRRERRARFGVRQLAAALLDEQQVLQLIAYIKSLAAPKVLSQSVGAEAGTSGK